jgi:hypothetical protein
MTDKRPGLNPKRLVALMQEAVARLKLDLSGAVTLTEAASGAYVVTPILAAMAGADQVFAFSRTTIYGGFEEIRANTQRLAKLAGVEPRLKIIKQKTREIVSQADIITNSGHVRPINAEMISWMKPGAVIPLMYEAWEFRDADLDLAACRKHGIRVAGTNERHPAVDVFRALGDVALKLLLDMGVAPSYSRALVLCDNDFAPFIERGLTGAGSNVTIVESLHHAPSDRPFDAVIVALKPQADPVITGVEAEVIARRWPGAPLGQIWGDVDRGALQAAGVATWPMLPPASGHMGVLPSHVGPEPVVRLQCGGLKVGEVLLRSANETAGSDMEFLDKLEPSDITRA